MTLSSSLPSTSGAFPFPFPFTISLSVVSVSDKIAFDLTTGFRDRLPRGTGGLVLSRCFRVVDDPAGAVSPDAVRFGMRMLASRAVPVPVVVQVWEQVVVPVPVQLLLQSQV
jgi:hypothetical protein